MPNLENLKKLRAHIAKQEPDRVYLNDFFRVEESVDRGDMSEREYAVAHLPYEPECGTAGCIAGYAYAFYAQEHPAEADEISVLDGACRWVGISPTSNIYEALFSGVSRQEIRYLGSHKEVALAWLDKFISDLESEKVPPCLNQ